LHDGLGGFYVREDVGHAQDGGDLGQGGFGGLEELQALVGEGGLQDGVDYGGQFSEGF